jgi:hypothetical protein
MAVDSRAALAKLTSGQTLTAEERKILNLGPAKAPAAAPTTGVVPGFKPQVITGLPTTGPVQGPLIGNNLGRDAAAILNAGGGQSFSAETKAAGQAYNVSQGLNPDGSKKTEITVDKDAYAILEEAFKFYGLDELVGTIKGYMQQNIGANEAKLKLKTEPAYLARFDGNTKRVAAGLNALDEATYLELENDYSETLKQYGIADYFGTVTDAKSRLARQKEMAKVIGADISAVEFKDRVSTAVTRVKNADTNTKDAFKALYGIGDTDLVKFFLDPAKGSQELKTKAAAAEISGAAVTAGLSGTSLGTAEELAKLGVDKATALEGYSTIAGYLPITSFLGDIYSESGVKYDRTAAEAEVFKGTASEKRKREQLKALEEASFQGSSGMGRTGQPLRNTGQF